jgi:hypothetical protein
MRELAYIRLCAVEGFLIDTLGQSFFRQRQRPALFRHELTLRQPAFSTATDSPHVDDDSLKSCEMKNSGGLLEGDRRSIMERPQHINSPNDVKALPVAAATAWTSTTTPVPTEPCPGRRVCQSGSPGALEEFDDIDDTVDRAWILHRGHLLQDCLG